MKPNPLIIIGGIFAASFLGRTISVADAALSGNPTKLANEELTEASPIVLAAATDTSQKDESQKTVATTAVKSDPLPAPAKPANKIKRPKNAAETYGLLAAIQERSDALDAKATKVEDRIRTLEIIEKRVAERISELQKSNDDLSKLIAFADEAAQEDITLLSKMYEQMKPKKAGEIFDKMDPTFAAGFLTEMNSEAAALILANMTTDKAYQTSMIIASRNAAVHSQ